MTTLEVYHFQYPPLRLACAPVNLGKPIFLLFHVNSFAMHNLKTCMPCSTREKSKGLGGTVSFENSLGVAPGGIHVRRTSWGALYDVQQRCNLFGARLHACSMQKNQRARVERWALRTMWTLLGGGSTL